MIEHIQWPPPGRYILAISGGADSMTLLQLMADAAHARQYHLIAAHFDHGLRPDSAADRQFVQAAAARLGLAFESHQASLSHASEAAARTARHTWLEQSRHRHQAAATITAHHQDDLIETSLLNLARGTGRRGLAPMQSGPILRPLLHVSRASLRHYAASHGIQWREDPTNTDLTNPRNFLRHQLIAQASPAWRRQYLDHLDQLHQLNLTVEVQLDHLLAKHRTSAASYRFPRTLIRDLRLVELEELIIAAAYQLQPASQPNRRLVQELALFAKTARPRHHRPLSQDHSLTIEKDVALLVFHELHPPM